MDGGNNRRHCRCEIHRDHQHGGGIPARAGLHDPAAGLDSKKCTGQHESNLFRRLCVIHQSGPVRQFARHKIPQPDFCCDEGSQGQDHQPGGDNR